MYLGSRRRLEEEVQRGSEKKKKKVVNQNGGKEMKTGSKREREREGLEWTIVQAMLINNDRAIKRT